MPTIFQVVTQGIGESFQLAVIMPQINLTGCYAATLQSWGMLLNEYVNVFPVHLHGYIYILDLLAGSSLFS